MFNIIKPKIEISKERKLIGKKLTMNFVNYTVNDLWRSFLSSKINISNNLSDELISMTIYNTNHFTDFKPTNEFEKWAAIEVTNFDKIPNDMDTFIVVAGLYAIFNYKGSSADNSIFEYIFGTWLPSSKFVLDDRPHFEVLGKKYKDRNQDSEEEIWIPLKQKQ